MLIADKVPKSWCTLDFAHSLAALQCRWLISS
jgi:hypothetical protein